MLDQDKILNFLKVIGPTLPAKVAKNIGSNILIASAHLSDLASQGKVRISNLKIGGSPLYYLSGQEEQLYSFALGNTNPKDLLVLNKLKERRVLREAGLELLEKVALRNLKDFAVPLRVNAEGKAELFWKWHLLPDEETNRRIGQILSPPKPAVQEAVARVVAPLPLEVKPAEKEKKEEKKELKEKEEEAREIITPLPEKAKIPEKPKKEEQKKLSVEKPKKPFLQKIKERISGRRKALPDKFLPLIEEFFAGLEIEADQLEIIRKNVEINFTARVPSAIGRMRYFCKAKNKKKCDEKDLSAAYMEAQIKKLPLLFLYSNELSKKAQEMLESGAFENAIIKKIE